jgi:hypothetical protein
VSWLSHISPCIESTILRIEIRCSICSKKDFNETISGDVRYSRLCTIRDDGIYEFECPEGHQSATVLRTPKHEVLFMIASNALLDGYAREAIASFAASLERFYEFAIRVICRSKLIQAQDFTNSWRIISKQSERQLGAFTMLWLTETKAAPVLLQDKMIELRNKVIHKGTVPTYKECLDFGQAVMEVISPIERRLIAIYPEHHKNECFELAKRKNNNSEKSSTILSIYSILDAHSRSEMTLDSCLNQMRLQRKRVGIQSVGVEQFLKSTVS